MKKIYIRSLFAMLLFIALVVGGCLSSSRWREEPVNYTGPVDIFAPGAAFKIREGVDAVSGQLLVRLKPGADPDQVFAEVDGREIQYYEGLDWYRIAFGPGFDLVSAGRRLLQTGQVYYVEPNYLVETCAKPATDSFIPPNDPGYNRQWGLEMINALAGWEKTMGSEEIIIAIVDTGIDNTHPDLEDKVIKGWDFTPSGPGEFIGDDEGHGTHVAGIAAARANNGIGIAGVAPGCQLISAKVLGASGSGTWADIAEGVFWAVDEISGYDATGVINMSLGGRYYSRVLQEAIEYALENDIPVVAAAGNLHKYYDDYYPAAYPGVISVGAVRDDKRKAGFSAKGGHVFLAAPGQGIYSTTRGGGYDSWNGTSMATPFVSGAVALLKSEWPDLDINGIHAQLRKTAKDLAPAGWDPETGWGLLDLGKALEQRYENDLFGTLEVTVVDEKEEPVPYARVFIKEINGNRVLTAMTTDKGKALFMAQPAGDYQIWVDGQLVGEGENSVQTVSAGCAVRVVLAAAGE